MNSKLPPLSTQKRFVYRTCENEINVLFDELNFLIFDYKLPIPQFKFIKRLVKFWGVCESTDHIPNIDSNNSDCIIHISEKWYCRQWLITHFAHEMVHQYQWDVISKERVRKKLKPIMSHGPSFHQFRPRFEELGMPLSGVGHSIANWWKYQDLFKC